VPHEYMNHRAEVLARFWLRSSARSLHVTCPSPVPGSPTWDPSVVTYAGSYVPVLSGWDLGRRMIATAQLGVAARRALKIQRFDCVRSISTIPTAIARAVLGRSAVPLIANTSDYYSDLYRGAGLPFPGLSSRVLHLVERAIVEASAVIVDSPEQRNGWITRGLSPAKCVVIPHGIPRSLYGPVSAPAPWPVLAGGREGALLGRTCAPPSGAVRIGYVGDISEMDGLDVLVRCLRILGAPQRRVELVVIGRGTGRTMSALSALAAEQGVSSSIEWIGSVSNSVLPQYLSACHVLVAPFRRWHTSGTSVPNKILEYMATDSAIVATRTRTLEWAFGDHLSYTDSESPEELACAIGEASSERSPQYAEARAAIRQRFSWNRLIALEAGVIDAVCEGDRAVTSYDFYPGGDPGRSGSSVDDGGYRR
jgi:glycosyltransferase involved in cell wall biosynthesis